MLNRLFEEYPVLLSCRDSIELALSKMQESYKHGGKLLLCGNGGSCADCDHIVGELMKGFMQKRPLKDEDKETFINKFADKGANISEKLQGALPAISLTAHSGVLSAFANDVDPALIYAQLVWGYGSRGDVLLGLSTSGNSENIINACMAASARGMITIGMCGERKCHFDEICDVVIHVPQSETYKIQELHLPVYHALCAELEEIFFKFIK